MPTEDILPGSPESWALGCGLCFQMGTADYASHLFANHSWDVFSALQRIAQ